MKTKDILKLTPGEMRERIAEFSQQYFELRMKKGLGQLKSPSVMRGLRKDIARMKMALSRQVKI
ncbi:MAG: 50S ribosomal protein L29 [Puniceicoccales bacterium]|jgi:large subunit ribosomal protein L29|nr:50S ribosomal protein L29 [Puniceicoccales bacterium]